MVGSIVYATEQGLGILAKDFYDMGVIDKVLVHPHRKRENKYDWYPDRATSLEELIETCDTFLFFETPFYWDIVPKLRKMGKKVIIMPMYECTMFPFPSKVDTVLCVSDLDYQFYKNCNAEVIRINVPVPEKIRQGWKLRKKANYFVHNAGNGGLAGRNGTMELLQSVSHIKKDFQLRVRSQVPLNELHDQRIVYEIGTFDYEAIWSDDDVFVFPEKFNGLSLPIQEAYASGMMVMCGNRFPMNTWLPEETMIPVHDYQEEKLYVDFLIAKYRPVDIARTIEKWLYADIEKYSYKAQKEG